MQLDFLSTKQIAVVRAFVEPPLRLTAWTCAIATFFLKQNPILLHFLPWTWLKNIAYLLTHLWDREIVKHSTVQSALFIELFFFFKQGIKHQISKCKMSQNSYQIPNQRLISIIDLLFGYVLIIGPDVVVKLNVITLWIPFKVKVQSYKAVDIQISWDQGSSVWSCEGRSPAGFLSYQIGIPGERSCLPGKKENLLDCSPRRTKLRNPGIE